MGEKLAGRTGGAVSLAVGMAQIFKGLPGMKTLTGYWYHYCIMFEALFILTTVDTGTRVARYVLHELLGKVHKPFSNTAWLPGNLMTSLLVVLSWGYLIYTGSISTIWPLFGTGNQLLATIALAVVTTFLVNMGKAKYACDHGNSHVLCRRNHAHCRRALHQEHLLAAGAETGPGLPGLSGYHADGDLRDRCVLVLIESARRCWKTLHGVPIPPEAFGPVKDTDVKMACC